MSAPQPKPWILGIHAYQPGKSQSASGKPLVKLSANENPLGSSPAALAALAAARAEAATYPDPDSRALREKIAQLHGLDPARVVCGTGSDELLNLAAQGFAGPRRVEKLGIREHRIERLPFHQRGEPPCASQMAKAYMPRRACTISSPRSA
jgi:hypothetical protein